MADNQNNGNGTTTTAVAPAKTAQPAPAGGSAGKTMEVAKHGATRKECELITRLNDRSGSPESLYSIFIEMTGDKLFVDKFIQCCKSQVSRAWKRVMTSKGAVWDNPFLHIPLNAQLDALYRCASRKVLPDGYNANLVPYICKKDPSQSKVEVVIDYKGLIDCAIREGIIKDADAKEVCENDDFSWDLGEVTRWHIPFGKPRGAVIGFCAWAILPDGTKKWHAMTLDEIADVKKCAKADNIWDRWAGEMSKKTVIRRLFKTLRNSPNLTAMMEVDNEFYEVGDGIEVADPKGTTRRRGAAVRQIVGQQAQLPAPEPEKDQGQDEQPPNEAEAVGDGDQHEPTPEQPEPVPAKVRQPVFA